MPSQCFLDYILRLEDSFVKNFSVYTKSTTVGGKLLKTLNGIPITFHATLPCNISCGIYAEVVSEDAYLLHL